MKQLSVHEILQNLGSQGGKKTLEIHGVEHFREISKLGKVRKKQLAEERKKIQINNSKI